MIFIDFYGVRGLGPNPLTKAHPLTFRGALQFVLRRRPVRLSSRTAVGFNLVRIKRKCDACDTSERVTSVGVHHQCGAL